MAETAAAQSEPREAHAFITQIDQQNGSILDPDELEAQEAQAALERESSGATQDDDGSAEPPPDTEKPPADAAPKADEADDAAGAGGDGKDADQQQQGGNQSQTVPYARFAEVNRRARDAEGRITSLERELSFLQGAMTATTASRQPQGGTTEPAPDPRQAIETQRQEADQAFQASAAKLDAGEISHAEHAQATIAYNRAIKQADAAEAKLDQPAPPKPTANTGPMRRSLADERILAEHVEKLQASHHYLKHLSEDQFQALVQPAWDLARAYGIKITSDAEGDMRLREMIAELSDRYGPQWYPDLQLPEQSTPAPTPAATPQQQPQLSPEAQARQAKLEQQQQHPPDTSNLGRAGSEASNVPTAAQIEQMTDDEIAALPPQVQERILEGKP